jgi:5'-phosphate synthase pdxT subunit
MTDNTVELNIGVLCVQGAFIEHVRALERVREIKKDVIRLNIVDVRKPAHLSGLDGLIIPGGESTTLSVFLSKDGFEDALREWISRKAVWGTCAGLILLANTLTYQKTGGQVTVRACLVCMGDSPQS